MGLMSRQAKLSNSAEGSGPSSGRGRGQSTKGDPVKTTLDHTKPKSPRHFRPRLLPLSHFLFFSNFKFLTNAPANSVELAPERVERFAVAATVKVAPLGAESILS